MKMIELETYRLSAESEPPTDQVTIHFDWIAGVEGGRITFKVRVDRYDRSSRIDFQIDLLKLGANELERLHDFLALRPKSYWLTHELTWLLTVSLRQQQPSWSEENRHGKVRELLLAGE